MPKAIKISDLDKTYKTASGDVHALKDISFSLEKGELFGLLGPNGAGKSTLINILGGVTAKSDGKASVEGIDIDKDHVAAKKKLGIVPQEISFDNFIPVGEALRLQFGYYGQQVDENHLEYVLNELALSDKRDFHPRHLSGGMKRRFMIARALIHRPDVLILDEPTAGVDVELRHELYGLIRRMNKRGVTIILTTHYLEEVELLCDRVAILGKGRIVALDEKQNLKDRFQSQRCLSIRVTEKTEIPKGLERFSPDWNDHELRLTFQRDEYDDILQAVAKADLPIEQFSVTEPTIEDVFMTVTNDKHV